MRARNVCLSTFALLFVAACGGEPTPPPAEPTTPTPETPAPATSAEPAPAPSGAPSASPSAKPSAEAPKSSGGSGRPPVLKMDPSSITDTFGSSPAAKLEIGDKELAILKIPEGALEKGYNVTFKLDPRGKATGVAVGKLYRMQSQVAGAPEFSRVESAGPPFEFTFPAGSKKDANLAIGEIQTDDKGKEKIVWTIVAPKKIDDTTGTALFEVSFLADAYLHITTKPPTAPAAPK